jgi:hypothetical protein
MGQTVVENPSGSQTIAQPSGTEFNVNRFEGILFANQFSSVQTAISNLPSSGGTIYIPPGSYVGPTSLPSNVSLIALSAQANFDMVGSWTSLNNTTTQVTLTYTGNLSLTNLQNVYLKGVTLDFVNHGAGLVLTSSSYNRFEDVSIVNAGSSTQAALTINTSGSGGANNSFKNTFDNLNVLCNQSQYCYAGVLLQGNASGETAVTLNTFLSLTISGAVNKAIDMEDWSDTNHFFDVEVNQDLPESSVPSTACVLCFNTTNSSTDIDANGSIFTGIGVTGYFPYAIQAGLSYGNIISGNFGGWSVKPLSSQYPSFQLTSIDLPGGGPGTKYVQEVLIGGHLGTSGTAAVGRNGDLAGSCALSSGSCALITFNSPYFYAPSCVVSWQSSGPQGVLSANMSAASIQPKSSVSTDNGVVEYHCIGNPY